MASQIIGRQPLRALDALQLATALQAASLINDEGAITFISSDEQLLYAVGAEGLATWNPATGPPAT